MKFKYEVDEIDNKKPICLSGILKYSTKNLKIPYPIRKAEEIKPMSFNLFRKQNKIKKRTIYLNRDWPDRVVIREKEW